MRRYAVIASAVATLSCADPTVPDLKSAAHFDRPTMSVSGAAVEVVLPSAFASVMGSSNNNFPHSFRNLRYQQVFSGSDIVDPTIVGLCLRKDDVAGGAERTQTLTIKLGPTTLDHTNLGSSFAANYSAPPTEVFTGDVIIPASLGGGTPADFDLCIPFLAEYVHPAGSNVIVEVINTSLASGNVPRDACVGDQPGCTTRRAYAFSPTATTAFSVEPGGLIMKFISPEPPAPTDPLSIEECKKGGWASFDFRNQGQCLRFVETGEDSRLN